MRNIELDVRVTRGAAQESLHCVSAAVVDANGQLVATARDPHLSTFWRSCAKPFQLMPLLESGDFDRLGWGSREIALACGSHGGEPEHVELAAAMLEAVGLEEGDLACGPHDPLSSRGLRTLRDSGLLPSRLHNNCSGKHAAMLARAVMAGWSPDGYERAEHRVQQSVLEMVARWSGVAPAGIARAVDGCGVVVFGLPLTAMAAAWASFSVAARRGEDAPARILGALRAHPHLMGGTDRFDTQIIQATDGQVVAKIGAEGVHCAAIPELGLGIALKVHDGSTRAQYPALISALQQLGALPEELPGSLEDWLHRPIRNSRGDVTGAVEPVAGVAQLERPLTIVG